MAYGFQNPITGNNGELVRASIHSPNYVPGSQGWTIDKDGSAQFSDITIRNSTTENALQLVYNGTPALGNLIMSIAATAGVDEYGNSYFAGVTNYDDLPDAQFVNLLNSVITLSAFGLTGNNAPTLGFGGSLGTPGVVLGSGQGSAANSELSNINPTAGNSAGTRSYVGINAAGLVGAALYSDLLPGASQGYIRSHRDVYMAVPITTGVGTFNHGCQFTPKAALMQSFGTTSAAAVKQLTYSGLGASAVTISALSSTGAGLTGTVNIAAEFFG